MSTNRWDVFYNEDLRVTSAPHTLCAEYAAEKFKHHGCAAILDLGCGLGRDSIYLASAGFRVTALEYSLTGLIKAKNRVFPARPLDISLLQADSTVLPFPEDCFDGIYCFGLLHEFLPPDADQLVASTLNEVSRVLKNGGQLVLTVLAGEPLAGLPYVRLFTEEMVDFSEYDLECREKTKYSDIGCTGSTDYVVWRCLYQKAK